MKEQLLELLGNELFMFSLHTEKDIMFESVRDIAIQGDYKKVNLTFRYKDVDFYGHMDLKELLDTFELQHAYTFNHGMKEETLYSNY